MGGYSFLFIASKYLVATTSNTIASASVISLTPFRGKDTAAGFLLPRTFPLQYTMSSQQTQTNFRPWTHCIHGLFYTERPPQFTTFVGLPSINARTLSAVICMMRSRASFVAHEICGVMMQFGACRSGFSAAIGSVDATSTAA